MTTLTVKTTKGMGWRPDLPDIRDLSFNDERFRASRSAAKEEALVALEKPLPPALCIPDSKLPQVFDQGNLGSCVGNCISTMMTYTRKVSVRSRLFIYYEARRLINETHIDAGCYIRDGIKVIANLGAPREDLWPYRENKVFVDPAVRADKDAATKKIVKYARLETREDFRRCIAEGYPFVIGFSTYDSLNGLLAERHGLRPLPKSNESMQGGHAVTVVGYNSNFKQTKWAKDARAAGVAESDIPNDVYYIRNSWGKDWGHDGNFVIDAAYLENRDLADDAWTIRNN